MLEVEISGPILIWMPNYSRFLLFFFFGWRVFWGWGGGGDYNFEIVNTEDCYLETCCVLADSQ